MMENEANWNQAFSWGTYGFKNNRGILTNEERNTQTNTSPTIKWKQALSFVLKGISLLNTRMRCLRAVSALPFIHRYCCVFKALITGGNSAGTDTSSR